MERKPDNPLPDRRLGKGRYHGLLVPTPPSVEKLREQLEAKSMTIGLLQLEQRLEYDDKWAKQALATIEEQDTEHALKTAKAYIGHQEALGQIAVEQAAKNRAANEQDGEAYYGPTPSSPQPQYTDTRALDNESQSSHTETNQPLKPIPVHPEVTEMCIDMHLVNTASILSSLEPKSTTNLDSAFTSAQKAYALACTTNYRPLIARCTFYIGLVRFRRGSVREAVEYFGEAVDAHEIYREGEWAREWLVVCDEIIERRGGDVSMRSTPAESPVTSGNGGGYDESEDDDGGVESGLGSGHTTPRQTAVDYDFKGVAESREKVPVSSSKKMKNSSDSKTLSEGNKNGGHAVEFPDDLEDIEL